MAQSFHLRALRIAAKQIGGEPYLRSYLMVPASDLYRWMRGVEPVPQEVMARVIEFLAEGESAASPVASIPAAPKTGLKRNLV